VLYSDPKQRMKSLRLGAGTKNDARSLGPSSGVPSMRWLSAS
jgi:hypothetical protein